MRPRILRITQTAAVLVSVLTATGARASDYDNIEKLVVLGYAGGISVAVVNLGFTAYDIRKAARGEAPGAGVAIAEVAVMAVEVLAIPAVSAALDSREPLPLFAVSLWPAALLVHGIWALTLDRPENDATESRSKSLDLAPTMSWAKDGPCLGVLGRF